MKEHYQKSMPFENLFKCMKCVIMFRFNVCGLKDLRFPGQFSANGFA